MDRTQPMRYWAGMTKSWLARSCTAFIIAGNVWSSQSLADERAALQAACWQPAALGRAPGENIGERPGRHLRIPNIEGLASERDFTAIAGTVRRVTLPLGKKLVALTFDLCETSGEISGYDGAIIDYLRSQHVKATFFAGGHWMATHKLRTQQLLSDPLFEIGTHGWGHRNTRLMSGLDLKREILAPSSTYMAIRSELSRAQCAAPLLSAFSAIPQRPKLFRFPFGACSAESLRNVSDAGLIAIQWDLSTGDPSPNRSARAIAGAMIHSVRPGSIVISHANGRGYHTGEALPMAIPALRAKGFEFVTVSELLAAGNPVVSDTCYDVHPGDTDKYDFLGGGKRTDSVWAPATHVRAAPATP